MGSVSAVHRARPVHPALHPPAPLAHLRTSRLASALFPPPPRLPRLPSTLLPASCMSLRPLRAAGQAKGVKSRVERGSVGPHRSVSRRWGPLPPHSRSQASASGSKQPAAPPTGSSSSHRLPLLKAPSHVVDACSWATAAEGSAGVLSQAGRPRPPRPPLLPLPPSGAGATSGACRRLHGRSRAAKLRAATAFRSACVGRWMPSSRWQVAASATLSASTTPLACSARLARPSRALYGCSGTSPGESAGLAPGEQQRAAIKGCRHTPAAQSRQAAAHSHP